MGDKPPSGGFVISTGGGLRTVVYVDGYNLYYGLLRKSKLKWLDLYSLFNDHVLDDQANLLEIRYYTAPVLGRMSDDSKSTQRQRTYLQALRNMYSGKLEIIEGKILSYLIEFQILVCASLIHGDLAKNTTSSNRSVLMSSKHKKSPVIANEGFAYLVA